MKLFLAGLFAVAACGGSGSNNGADGSVDSPVAPMMITISGTATARGGLGGAMPVADAVVAAYTNADEATPLAMAMTDAAGVFSLVVTTTNGQPVDGFLKATKTGMKVSYLYPPTPVAADLAMVPMNMLTTDNYQALSTIAQGNQMPANGLVAMIVISGADPSSTPIGGATITSTPAASPYRYNGTNGLPSSTATATQADGIAYAFNAPPGAFTVMAAKTGSTFKPTALTSHADALTTTLIIPQ